MATVDYIGEGTSGHPARDYVKGIYTVSKTIKLATAATSRGSNLVATDVIQCLQLPANTMLLGGGVEVTTATTSVASAATFDFGYSGSVDIISDGFNPMVTGLTAAGTNGSTTLGNIRRFSTATTLDLTLQTAPNAGINDGILRVYAVLADIA